jgi:hypothetical protein
VGRITVGSGGSSVSETQQDTQNAMPRSSRAASRLTIRRRAGAEDADNDDP